MNSPLLVKSLETLIACEELGELAGKAAELAQRWLDTTDALVLLRSGDAEHVSGEPNPGLRAFAERLLTVEAASGVTGADGRLAALLHGPNLGVRGVLVVTPGHPEDSESAALLGALAELTASRAEQIQSRALTSRALEDTRVLVTRGLHDLCTSLNVLRLGMHLLEPTLTTKDAVVAQRAHRAVDKMAALIGTMADAVSNDPGGALPGGVASSSAKAASL